ncbi:MAG TPA: metal ABC transporter permease, partial [Hyphomicrobiaceae bacterium]|nr:metal ABC transporter permease [Hyphomicrobiaceae bacterium]
MLEPFLVRALVAGLGLAIVAAPLGCFVVWQRMAYFGETVAQAGLIGVALGLALQMNLTLGVMLIAVVIAFLLIGLSRQKAVALDSILGLLHHASLAVGVIATAMINGPPVDLMGFLFGDVFAITSEDLVWIFAGGAVVLVVVA